MKKIYLLISLVLILLFNSCDITEKLIINEDGSGKFSYEIDGSKMVSLMGDNFKDIFEDEKKLKKRNKKDGGLKTKKVIDSTFTFKELFVNKQDSILKLSTEEQQKIKTMERFSVRIFVNQDEGKMSYSIFTDFKSIQELQEIMSPLQSMKTISPNSKNNSSGLEMDGLLENSKTIYFYNGNSFKKTVSKIKKEKEIFENSEEYSDSIQNDALKLKKSFELFYGQSNYKLVYQFPKVIKKASLENLLYSEDKKTITVEYSFKDYIENPEKLSLEVEFE